MAVISPEPLVRRVAIYTRFSDDMQSRRSAADQERECRAFAERQVGWEVVLVRADEAVRSGASINRTGYTDLLEQAQRRVFDILLVEEMSRFSREFLGGLSELGKLTSYGVRLADTKSGLLDLTSPVGQLHAAFNLVNSQQETQRLGERSKRGLKGKTLDRFSSGGQPPYGYMRKPVFSSTRTDVDGRPVREGVRFEPDPVEAPILKRIFALYRDGMAKHGIAGLLNSEGVSTRRKGGQYKGRPASGTWTAAGIKSLLENRIYIGERVWNRSSRTGQKLPGSGKRQQLDNAPEQWVLVREFAVPLIDLDLWEAVEGRRADDGAKYKKHHVANNNRQYLLSGLIRCATCGANYVIGAHQGRPRVPHYRCSFHTARGSAVCSNRITVSRPALEERICRTLEIVVKDPKQLELLVAEHNRRVSSANESQLAVVRNLEAQLASSVAKRDRLMAAIEESDQPVKSLVQKYEERHREVEKFEEQIEAARSRVQPLLIPRSPAVIDYLSGSASIFTDDFVNNRRVIEGALEGVLIFSDGSVVLRFHQQSFFAPVQEVRLAPVPPPAPPSPLPSERGDHSREVELARRLYEQAAAPHLRGQQTVHLEQDSEGNLAPIVFTTGAVTVSRAADSPAPEGRKITLASPAGS